MKEPERISEERARQILERAAELDRRQAELVSLDTLRDAATEAGISASSFEAAVREEAAVRIRPSSPDDP